MQFRVEQRHDRRNRQYGEPQAGAAQPQQNKGDQGVTNANVLCADARKRRLERVLLQLNREALKLIVLACPFRKTGIDPRIKSEGWFFAGYALD